MIVHNRCFAIPRYFLLVFAITILLATGLSEITVAADIVDVDIVVPGTSTPVDTLYYDTDYEIRFFLENDQKLGGISLGFALKSDDGATWTWNNIGESMVSIVSGCRMDPPETVWDMMGFILTEKNTDGISSDTVMFGGVAIAGGVNPGTLEHMISMSFTPDGPNDDVVHTICIDSAFVAPFGDFLFSFIGGMGGVTPTVIWNVGGKCWPAKKIPNDCPVWDAELPTTLEADHCDKGKVRLSATDPEEDMIMFSLGTQTGGSGYAELTDVGNGRVDVTYYASKSDVGESITLEVEIYDEFHPIGNCDPYLLNVFVTNDGPFINCGMPVYYVNEGNDVVKTDIVVMEPNECDEVTFVLSSGEGEINEVTGVYTWTNTTGVGSYDINIYATDSYGMAIGSFIVEVLEAIEDTCATSEQLPGDINNDGSINVNDISFFNNFIYRGGQVPDIMANADVNGDCFVDEVDVAYLAAAILDGGPAPVECTCVNPFVCDCYIGDANNDLSVNIGDAVYIINSVFKGGPPPKPYILCNGDANKDCSADVGDAVYIINTVFKEGPRPAVCHEWIDGDTGCGWIVRE
ncbi:MAG: dockerin type I domain-containing protein [candidate division Zixibacteria bacterium]